MISLLFVAGVYEKFRASVVNHHVVSRPNEKVLNRIALSYATAMMVACEVPELAHDLYRKIKDLPETFTRLQISLEHHINLNGEANLGNPNLLSAVDMSGNQLVVKVLKINDDARLGLEERRTLIAQEMSACDILGLQNTLLPFANIEVIKVQHDNIIFSALKMPKYVNTVASSAKFFYSTLNREGLRLVEAIAYMHSKNLVHMDIKGANIFIGAGSGGPWHLGDFGSSRKIGDLVLSTTFFFYKEDVLGKPALPEYDWYMFLVVILIESLADKHCWTALQQESTKHICDVKLRRLFHDMLSGELGQLLRVIADKLEWKL